jgi:hypothetical protein
LRLFPKLHIREPSLGRLYQAAPPYLSIGLPYIDLRPLIKKRKQKFSSYIINSDGIGCKVIYEEGLPNISRKYTNIFTIYEEVVCHI